MKLRSKFLPTTSLYIHPPSLCSPRWLVYDQLTPIMTVWYDKHLPH